MKTPKLKTDLNFEFDIEDEVPTINYIPSIKNVKTDINIIVKKRKRDSSTNKNLF